MSADPPSLAAGRFPCEPSGEPTTSSQPDASAEDTIQKLADVDKHHHLRTSIVQCVANQTTEFLGRPTAAIWIMALVVAWMAANYAAASLGRMPLDVVPFPVLEFVATIAALLVTLLILTTQRHADELADRRAHLTLQIALLNEKKSAKIISLLEEQRRDNPLLTSRPDLEASEMACPADALDVFDRLDSSSPADIGKS